jgi:serine protease inhibitor
MSAMRKLFACFSLTASTACAATSSADKTSGTTLLRVNEKGTEAAAATDLTTVVTGARAVPPSLPRMIVDHPSL